MGGMDQGVNPHPGILDLKQELQRNSLESLELLSIILGTAMEFNLELLCNSTDCSWSDLLVSRGAMDQLNLRASYSKN